MGTWGPDLFQNDYAAEAAEEIINSSHPFALIGAWFDKIIDTPDFALYADGDAAIAAAAVLDLYLNKTDYPFFNVKEKWKRNSLDAFLASGTWKRIRPLYHQAEQVLYLIIGKRCVDNWNIAGLYEEWRKNVEGLIERLGRIKDSIYTCESCGRPILYEEEYQLDEDGVAVCQNCCKKEAQGKK